MTVSGNLDGEERLAWLRAQLNTAGKVRIATAASELNVSEMTIRRDLQELEEAGLLRRVRGGAVATGPLPFEERHRRRARAKSQIAAKLAPLVPETGAVGIDASSTMLRLASTIESARGLSVLTNSIETFQALQGKQGLTALLTGGELDPRTGSLVGPLASRPTNDLLLRRLFVSAAAVDHEIGASEACLEEAEVKRALASVAGEVVLAVDSSKLDARANAVGLGWDLITMFVTELDPEDVRLDPYRTLAKIL